MTTDTVERQLLRQLTCPHCWAEFRPQEVHWVAEHPDLLGDPVLGPEEMLRFLPTRFTVDGRAVDPKGVPCARLACPKCHLVFPEPLLETKPVFMSLLGAPASGKSFLLAAASAELRRVLPSEFCLSFTDTEPELNRHLAEYEDALFGRPDSSELVPLAALIRKTEEHGDLYHTVSSAGHTMTFPRPILFTIRPQSGHPKQHRASRTGRVLCLYDNAGESFLPGKDTAGNPVTRHMARARVLFFLFDPLQEPRFYEAIQQRRHPRFGKTLPPLRHSLRQHVILGEAAARIRRFTGKTAHAQLDQPLVVVVTKFDLWAHLLESDPPPEPWVKVKVQTDGGRTTEVAALDTRQIERQSTLVRRLLSRVAPDVVGTAESYSNDVTYVPVSAVGWKVRLDENRQFVVPVNAVRPYWVTVPFLYGLARGTSDLVPSAVRKKSGTAASG